MPGHQRPNIYLVYIVRGPYNCVDMIRHHANGIDEYIIIFMQISVRLKNLNHQFRTTKVIRSISAIMQIFIERQFVTSINFKLPFHQYLTCKTRR